MTTWIYLAMAILGWGFGLFLMKIATKYIDNWTAVVFNLPGYLMIGLLLVPKVKWSGFVWNTGHTVAVIVGACYVIANWGFYRAAENANISILTPMSTVFMVIPIVLGTLFLHERPTTIQYVGMLLAFIALILLGWPEQVKTQP